MADPILMARADDEASVEILSRVVSGWEPRLDVLAARDNPMIYEPDGTLYAVAIAPPSTLVARHKPRPFRPGDLAIIPRAVAIDAEEPGASYVAVRHDGTPPYHFRERFIQTWGYEHRPAGVLDPRAGFDDVIPEDDPRFRSAYRRVGLGPRAGFRTGLDMHLWIGLEGTGAVVTAGGTDGRAFGPGDLILIRDGADYSVEGRGVAGRFLLCVESAYEARLAASLAGPGRGISPEFGPGG